jgi:hypothetical protein
MRRWLWFCQIRTWTSRRTLVWATACLAISLGSSARAGVINPDISVIGQPFFSMNDDPLNPERKRVRFDVGETEFVFDAYLNPYAKGTFVTTLSGEGFELEEGYFDLFRSLPLGLALKGGKYRVGFGRLNAIHPHANPFAEPFLILRTYLPGEEGLNETGVSLSERIPVHGDFSLNVAADWLQGDSFRIEREPAADPNDPIALGGDDRAGESRSAGAGRLSGFAMLGEQSAIEFGLSATAGTNNVAASTVTRVYGADVKAKLWPSPRSYIVLQGEALMLDREDATWSPVSEYSSTTVDPVGGYFYADYNFGLRYNLGASFERFQEPTVDEPWTHAAGVFAGLSLLEETTVFRLDYVHVNPEVGDETNQVTLRIIYSMGPHKAHSF